ncbi:MAG: oligosaccharide flippase family protein [Polyangiaceae bacterium]|nr:oligosaccharide flippase family protein [Polyangiaceae bacterium]
MASRQSTIIRKTVGGAAWTVFTGVGSRVIGGVGTIVVTYFISPEIAGEVKVAYILVFLSHMLTTFGITHYIAAKPKVGPDVVWHATLLHVATGIPAILASIPIAYLWAWFFDLPRLLAYVPGFVVAVLFERLHLIPERVLARELRFRPIGIARGLGEILYTAAVICLAVFWPRLGFVPESIGMSIVYANILQYAFMFLYSTAASNRRTWLTPSRFSWDKARDILRFGIPISVAGLSAYASRNLDTLIFAKMFGPAVTGAYDKAYNFADIPAVQVGEQIGDVLLPSFAQMEVHDRRKSLIRSTALLSLIIFPLATGLGAVSHSLVEALLPQQWWQVGPMLAVLAGLAVVRPLGWTIMSYLQACDRPRTVMVVGLLKVVVLLASVALFGLINEYWACVGVSIGFLFHAVAGMWVIRRVDNIPMSDFVRACAPPLLACIPMVGAVLGTRWLWHRLGVDGRGLGVGVEVLAGAGAYVPAALVIARGTSRDLLGLVRDQVRRRRGDGRASDPPSSPGSRHSSAPPA